MSNIHIQDHDLTIRDFSEEHLSERYVAWLNDSEVVKYSEQRHHSHSLSSCKDYYESIAGSDNLFLAIETSDITPHHIGNIGVGIDKFNNLADVSIIIGEKKAWGKGYATRAWCAVLDHLANQMNIRKITAGTMSCNTPMINLMKRSHMIIEAERPKHFILDSQEIGFVMAARYAKKDDTLA